VNRTMILAFILVAGSNPLIFAHDTWVQTNTAVVRTGDAVHIDLMLGNHGNDHRDFKLASKISPDRVQSLTVNSPDGKSYDLKPELIDLGYAPKEGFHSARFVTGTAGLYTVAQTADGVVNHGTPTRSVRSAKAYFLAADSLDKLPRTVPGFEKPLGHRIELVPETNPVADCGPGRPIKIRLLFEGNPLPGVKVSFIPRGVTLKEGTDPDFERVTDADGRAAFTPKTGTYHLIVAHHERVEKGANYESAKYTATLTVLVPEKCPCCGD
jgi:uncharacterized GH25 family protein